MVKALLIGCGNIGAGYDLHQETKVWSHAKAYANTPGLQFTVVDTDAEKAREVAETYGARYLPELADISLRAFDIVSITTPTTTHFNYLSSALTENVPVIICEKPVVGNLEQTAQLESIYRQSSSKVLVNYIRRFQPAYQQLNKMLLGTQEQIPRSIVIKYKRGFLNNASHAVDLLELLLGEPFLFQRFQFSIAEFDAFDYDPTLTATCLYGKIPVSFIGISQVSYAVFELEFFFASSKIVVCHSGNEIRFYSDVKGNLVEQLALRQTGILDAYMLPVMQEAMALVSGTSKQDNFLSALQLNKRQLQIIESIKTTTNATASH
ncbi:Gfo/Idh/MocA family oxidoreductase [Flavisolibacter sp. BT320]|nr:Gfo/Idh/MocA family oxidoreductase [Flavisolibacter longurius]